MGKKIQLLFLVFGLAFFCYLVGDFGIRNILINIERTGWWFVPVVATWGVVYLFNALAWQVILGDDGKAIGFAEIFRITLSSFAISYTTPFMNLGGEPFRILAIQNRIGTRSAVSSALLYRMLHSFAFVIFWLIAIVVVVICLPLTFELRLYLAITALILLTLSYSFFALLNKGVLETVTKALVRIPLLKGLNSRLLKRKEAILDVDEKIRSLYNSRRNAFYRALAFEVISRFISSIEFYFILRAIGTEISLLDAFYINAATTLILNILFFIPFELGTREGSLYLVMQSLNFTAGMGIYVSLVSRIRELFWILIGLGLIHFSGGTIRQQKAVSYIEQKQT